jgi:hypothetical protein
MTVTLWLITHPLLLRRFRPDTLTRLGMSWPLETPWDFLEGFLVILVRFHSRKRALPSVLMHETRTHHRVCTWCPQSP